jgi:hypothetical protein
LLTENFSEYKLNINDQLSELIRENSYKHKYTYEKIQDITSNIGIYDSYNKSFKEKIEELNIGLSDID